MTQPRHILICGEIGVGKSTLIQRLLAHNARPVYGFLTRRLEADATGRHPVYINPAGAAKCVYTAENRVGVCGSKFLDVSPEVFDTLGVEYLSAPENGVIVMDELGFMEARAALFVQAVFAALDGHVPVIAAVKARFDVPFLNRVRAHPNAQVFTITVKNRDALYWDLVPLVSAWNRL
jgi:nucleoside-triphosphatase